MLFFPRRRTAVCHALRCNATPHQAVYRSAHPRGQRRTTPRHLTHTLRACLHVHHPRGRRRETSLDLLSSGGRFPLQSQSAFHGYGFWIPPSANGMAPLTILTSRHPMVYPYARPSWQPSIGVLVWSNLSASLIGMEGRGVASSKLLGFVFLHGEAEGGVVASSLFRYPPCRVASNHAI